MPQIQVLPQRTSLGVEVGSALREAFNKRYEEQQQYNLNRSRLQQAIGQARNAYGNKNVKPGELALDVVEALAGIPGSERYAPQLIDTLLKQRQADYAAGAYPSSSGQPTSNMNRQQFQPSQQGYIPSQETFQPSLEQQMPGGQAQAFPGKISATDMAGITGASTPTLKGGPTIPINTRDAEEAMQIALQQAQASGDISNLPSFLDAQLKINEEKRRLAQDVLTEQQLETQRQADILQRDQQLTNLAKSKNPNLNAEQLNDFMRIGQNVSKKNPTEWVTQTDRLFNKFQNTKDQVKNAFVPGGLRGLIYGGERREQDLNKLIPAANTMKALGQEQWMRSKLLEKGLTPTEVAKVMNPLDDSLRNAINKVPKGLDKPVKTMEELKQAGTIERKRAPKIEKLYESKVTDLLLDNLGDNSLLAMRDYLMNNKNYSWQQFFNGLQNAQENGLILNPQQQAELIEASKPPRDSLENVFYDISNVWDWVKGAR